MTLTGRRVDDVAHEVVGWYIHTPEFQAAKQHYKITDTGQETQT